MISNLIIANMPQKPIGIAQTLRYRYFRVHIARWRTHQLRWADGRFQEISNLNFDILLSNIVVQDIISLQFDIELL